MSIVISIIGIMALLSVLAYDFLSRQTRFQQFVSEVSAIAAGMRRFAGSEGVVSKDDSAIVRPACGNPINSANFEIRSLRLRKQDRTISSPTIAHARIPGFTDDLPIRAVPDPSNAQADFFVHPYSTSNQGYEIETRNTGGCIPDTSSFTSVGITQWQLLIYEVPDDLHPALEKALRGHLASLDDFQTVPVSGTDTVTVTVTFDEKRTR